MPKSEPTTPANDDVTRAPESGDPVEDGRKSRAEAAKTPTGGPVHPGDAVVGEDRESGYTPPAR